MTRLPILALIALASSCACSSSPADDTDTYTIELGVEPTDTSAFNLGYGYTARMLDNCHSQAELQSELIDLRSREYNIRSRVGAASADDYLRGVKTCLADRGDTLLHTLFPEQ